MGVLVGRDREIDAIDAAIERALRGERAAVMLSGEPGIGKSRLLDELATRVGARNGIATWGRSAEVGLTPAFWPWMQALAALQEPNAPSSSPTPALDNFEQPAAAARLARFEEVVRFVQARSRRGLVALLFDDAHHADLASLQLVEYALPRLVGNVVVAVAARDGDATPATQAMLGKIQRAARRLPLARLGRDDVTRMCGDRIDASRIWELTEGNPLFVEELLSAGTTALPSVSSVRAIIGERIERMPEGTGELLAAAALLGREFRAGVVAEICSIPDGDAIRRLDPVLRLGMVSAMSGDRYRFSHALVAEALADELDPSERARLHLRAAQAIEKRDDGEPAAVAHHLLAAGHLAAEAAVVAAERAATAAMAKLGFEDAAALLERAIAALVLAAPSDRARRATLQCRRAEALQHAGEHARAAELCDDAAHLAREIGDAELLARIAIVRGLEFRYGRTDPLLVTVLREALAALGDRREGDRRDVLRAKLMARVAAAEQPAFDASKPVAEALAAIELARDLPDRDRLEVAHTACSALIEYYPAAQLEPILRDVLAFAHAAGDRILVVHTSIRLTYTAIERIDRAGFELLLADVRPRVAALGLARWTRTLHLIEGARALLDGRFADAERAADAADAAAASDADRWLVDVHRLLAAFTRAVPVATELRELAASHPPASSSFACAVAFDRGIADEIRAAIAQFTASPGDPELQILAASAIGIAGSDAQREGLYAMTSARRGRVALTSLVGSAVMDLYDRASLVLAAGLQRWDAIDRHAEDALSIAERLASPVWATRVRADWADALDGRGRPGDRDRARELRIRAVADAERLGMPLLVERCRRYAIPSAPISPPAPREGSVEFARSGELWNVRGFGEQCHVKDSRGVQMLARLVGHPGREVHALELSGAGGAVDGGDAGEVLDATARAAYRDRLRELTAQRDEAESWGDLARVERATAEIEALTDELERAVGLGGRERRTGSASERARSNVQRRINHALQQIRSACPRIGEHLAATVHTGTYCRYGQ